MTPKNLTETAANLMQGKMGLGKKKMSKATTRAAPLTLNTFQKKQGFQTRVDVPQSTPNAIAMRQSLKENDMLLSKE